MKLKLLFCISLFFLNIGAKPAPEVQELEQEDCFEQWQDCLSLGLCSAFVASTSVALDAMTHQAIFTRNEPSIPYLSFLAGFGMVESIREKINLNNRNMARRDARAKILAEAKKTKVE